ncbi:MAG: helix-turn-helix domain-containing protein [Pseudonocardiaceae bacterium]
MSFSPSRLTIARKRRRMTLSRLSKESGISRQMLSAYSNGSREPSTSTVKNLADKLQVHVEFLAESDVDEIPEEAVSFRARTKLTASQKDGALAAAAIALLLENWIEVRFNLPKPDVPTLPKLPPEQAAEVVRVRWGLGSKPIDNMLHLIEAHGVRVYSLAEEFLDVDGFSMCWKGTPVIWLSTRKSGERSRFDAAHELGHLVLHSEERSPEGPAQEEEANRFAAAFLMPRSSIIAARLHHASASRILSAKRQWKVAAMALTHRLHELGEITDWEYRQACIQLSRLGYRRSEPDGITRESSQLLQKVFQAVREDYGTVAHIARELHISTDELNEHVFGLVPVAVEGGALRTKPLRPALQIVEKFTSGE